MLQPPRTPPRRQRPRRPPRNRLCRRPPRRPPRTRQRRHPSRRPPRNPLCRRLFRRPLPTQPLRRQVLQQSRTPPCRQQDRQPPQTQLYPQQPHQQPLTLRCRRRLHQPHRIQPRHLQSLRQPRSRQRRLPSRLPPQIQLYPRRAPQVSHQHSLPRRRFQLLRLQHRLPRHQLHPLHQLRPGFAMGLKIDRSAELSGRHNARVSTTSVLLVPHCVSFARRRQPLQCRQHSILATAPRHLLLLCRRAHPRVPQPGFQQLPQLMRQHRAPRTRQRNFLLEFATVVQILPFAQALTSQMISSATL